MSKYDDIDAMELDNFLRANPELGVDDFLQELRGQARGRATIRTPGSSRRRKVSRVRSRSVGTRPMALSYPSSSNSRSASRPRSSLSRSRKMNIDTPLIKRVQYTQSRKVRHNNARKVLNKMPAGGKPYAKRRMTSRKPKGAYRDCVY